MTEENPKNTSGQSELGTWPAETKTLYAVFLMYTNWHYTFKELIDTTIKKYSKLNFTTQAGNSHFFCVYMNST
jgi:hypothetical protein